MTTTAPERRPTPTTLPPARKLDISDDAPPELSVVMPCLNEADTLGVCLDKAFSTMARLGVNGEVVVADNGSTDGSQQIAAERGARVVDVPDRGYGNALMGGIAASRGRYVVMGDADDSYDFLDLGKFVEKLREGHDLVQGCRLPAGGGTVRPGAMPWSHRWIGNPAFTMLARRWFAAPMHDVYCGYRGFSRAWYDTLGLRSPGMEFATEMIIKSARFGGRIAEVPITLHPDGRVSHPPHLRTVRDGWRTLRFYLMYSPKWLFLVPGLTLIALGLIGLTLGLTGARIGPAHLGGHTAVVSAMAVLCGYASTLLAVGLKTVAMLAGYLPPDTRMDRLFARSRLERGLLAGAALMLAGVGSGRLGCL